MRIIIHTDEYYPTCQACAFRMQIFAEVFTQMGHSVTVITSSANRDAYTHKQERAERIIYTPTIKMRKKTAVMRLINNLSFAAASVFSAIYAGKADVVITTSPPPLSSISGWLVSRMKRARLVYDVRDIWPEVALQMASFDENSLYCKLFRHIADFMYTRADLITTVSHGKVDLLKSLVPTYMQAKIRLISNGFDLNLLKNEINEEIIREYDLDTRFTCVYIGNIGLAQGLDAVLDIAEQTRHKHIQFLLFGKGAEKERLEKRVAEAKLINVRFCGVLEHSTVYTVLSKSRCSIIPLKNERMQDSIPTKLYEALGTGCPVFLLANGDACEIVQAARLGECVSPDAGEKIVKAFDEFIDNYESYRENAALAKELMRDKHSRQAAARQLEQQLHTL